MTQHNRSSGFSIIEALLVVVIIGILGLTGWYVYHAKQSSDKNYAATSSTTPAYKKKPNTKQAPAASTTTSQYSSWNSGSLKREGLTFKYPANWTLVDNSQTAGVCAVNAQNCPDRSIDSVSLTAPSGLVMNISAGEDPANLTPRRQGQGCPAPQDTCTQYANTPIALNGKTLNMVIWGYKQYNVAENLYVGLSQYSDCVLSCTGGLGTAQKLPGDISVGATYPNRDDATYAVFANDAAVKDAELVTESLHY